MSPERRRLVRIALCGIDVASFLFLASWHQAQQGNSLTDWAGTAIGLLCLMLSAEFFGLHNPTYTPGEGARFTAVVIVVGATAAFCKAIEAAGYPSPSMGINWLFVGALMYCFRRALDSICRSVAIPVAIVGAGPISQRMRLAIDRQPWGNLRFGGFYPDQETVPEGFRVLDGRKNSQTHGHIGQEFGYDGQVIVLDDWIIAPAEGPGDGLSARVKRFLDIVLALFLLVPICFVILPFALFSMLFPPRSPFHRQVRLTFRGREFWIYKLRTMCMEAEPGAKPIWPSADDNRITAIGKLLRNMWLDELPQVWNVLKGDLSWVGPRPERPEFAQVFSKRLPRYALRHRAPAGVTGLAQIRGFAGNTSLRKRLACDLEYIRSWSPWLDAKVLLGTICQIFVRRRQLVFDFVPGDEGRIP